MSEKQALQYQKVTEIKESMLKIQQEVDDDEIAYKAKFLGVIEMNFKQTVKFIFVIGVAMFPSVFKK